MVKRYYNAPKLNLIMKQLFALCLLSFVVIDAQAQTSVWRVSSGENEIYLAGSVHLLKESDYPLPQEFDVAFEKSDKVVFETDIDKLNDPQIAQVLLSKAMISDNKTLKDILSEDVYKKLEEESSKLSIPLASLSRLKPSMVIITMTGIKMQQMSITADGVDQHFHKRAKELGKVLGFLETVEEQLDVLTSMGDGNEDSFVSYSLEDMDEMESAMNELTGSWRNGSSDLMTNQLTEMKIEYPEIYKSIMVNRNNNWMPQIVDFLEDKPTEFVIVGALHLHGSDGLLAMLKAKGYQVEQLQ